MDIPYGMWYREAGECMAMSAGRQDHTNRCAWAGRCLAKPVICILPWPHSDLGVAANIWAEKDCMGHGTEVL